MKNIFSELLNQLEKDNPLALATIIKTVGSSPQVPGASALFSHNKLMAGTLGGGLLEAEAQKKASEALKEKDTILCQFSLNAELYSEKGAICGGEVQILIDGCPEKQQKTYNHITQSLKKRNSGVLLTSINLVSGEKVNISRHWIEKKTKKTVKTEELISRFKQGVEKDFFEGKPRLLQRGENLFSSPSEKNLLFLEPVSPLPQLVILGAGHIGRVVAHLGSLLDFEVTVIDDRPEFANKKRIPDADHIVAEDTRQFLKKCPVSPDTYLVIVTRGHQHDSEALRQVISSNAAYIGMIGSHRKITLMRKQFIEKKWCEAYEFDRIYAPIGLDINSKTVEEIAISIAAQLVMVRNKTRTES